MVWCTVCGVRCVVVLRVGWKVRAAERGRLVVVTLLGSKCLSVELGGGAEVAKLGSKLGS